MDPDEKDSEGKAFAARTVFVVGPEKQLKLALLYPSSTGRNFGEASGGGGEGRPLRRMVTGRIHMQG